MPIRANQMSSLVACLIFIHGMQKAVEVLLESKVVLVVTLVIISLDFFLHFLITIISKQLNASNMFDRTLKQKKSMKRRGQHWLYNSLQKPRF